MEIIGIFKVEKWVQHPRACKYQLIPVCDKPGSRPLVVLKIDHLKLIKTGRVQTLIFGPSYDTITQYIASDAINFYICYPMGTNNHFVFNWEIADLTVLCGPCLSPSLVFIPPSRKAKKEIRLKIREFIGG